MQRILLVALVVIALLLTIEVLSPENYVPDSGYGFQVAPCGVAGFIGLGGFIFYWKGNKNSERIAGGIAMLLSIYIAFSPIW